MECIICNRDCNNLLELAYHVKDAHSRQAKRVYREGKWKVNGPAISIQGPSLFDAIDSTSVGAESQKGSMEVATPEAPDSFEKPDNLVIQSTVPVYIEPKADLVVGDTGSGKTTNIGEVSDYVLRKYGKLTRMIGADKGGFGPLTGMVKSGQISYWAVNAWKNPIAAMHKAVRGYWPLRLDDPESPLVEPDAGTWEVYGFGAIEGLTSFGDAILQELKDKKASLSQDPSYTWSTGGVEFSGGNQSYYGFMQDQLGAWVGASHLLGFEKILWTSLESKGPDESGTVVYGPMIGGKKAAKKAGNWFCNYFHMDVVMSDKKKAVHVLFLKTHIDPLTFVPFPCKVRAPKAYSSEVPDFLPSGSIADAYILLDKLYEKQEKDSVGKMSEISGLRDRLLENAAKAKKAEQVAAEKRAKAASLLKPMVSVPGMPVSGPVVPKAVSPLTVAGPVSPKPGPVAPVVVPLMPTIQNVRKK